MKHSAKADVEILPAKAFAVFRPDMETPLTPLEFARRARKLYPEQIAVIDGESRWTMPSFSIGAIVGRRFCSGSELARAIVSPISRPILMRSWSRSTPSRN
jgi:hypothetical protein